MKTKTIPDENNILRAEIERLGWRGLDERVWERLSDFQQGLIILAPPLDTIPSPNGNAIYTLVEEIASRMSVPVLVLARWPGKGEPIDCEISDRVLYDTRPLKPSWLEVRMSYRVKRTLFGTGAPFYADYARRAARACQLLGAKTIVVEDIPVFALQIRKQNSRAHIYLHQHNDAPKSVPFCHWRRVVSSLDGVIFVAKATESFTENLHGKLKVPSFIVYNGVDLAHYDSDRWRTEGIHVRQELGIRPDEKVLLFIGRISPVKGIAEAADAFNLAGIANSHFLVIGNLDGNLFSKVEYTQRLKLAAKYSNGKIHLVGEKPQSEIPAFYVASNVVIVPSIGSEGLPKVITEALAMGKPCLVSKRGGILELIHENNNGWVIPDPQNIPDLATRISLALSQAKQIQVERSSVDIERMVIEFQHAIGLDEA